MIEFDAVVVGAGPAGGSAAFFLAREGWKVAIVEKSSFPRRKVCGEFVSATTRPVLDAIGVAEAYDEAAGPPIKRVGYFSGRVARDAEMPRLGAAQSWGRAVNRARLDSMILNAAQEVGAEVWQPWKVSRLNTDGGIHECHIENGADRTSLKAPVVILAHGSWERSDLESQPSRPKSPSDLLAFKFLFRGASLSPELMPLLAFPGGYGGMVSMGDELVGLSCCVRRDVLRDKRVQGNSANAGDATLRHIRETTQAVDHLLADAVQEGIGLASGPIRPGFRTIYSEGLFQIGNAGGEAHPIIAEGISMAIQSGHLLASHLGTARSDDLELRGKKFSAAWHAQFAGRIRAANLFAYLAMRPQTSALMSEAIRVFPKLLTVGAALSGKTKRLPILAVNPNPY